VTREVEEHDVIGLEKSGCSQGAEGCEDPGPGRPLVHKGLWREGFVAQVMAQPMHPFDIARDALASAASVVAREILAIKRSSLVDFRHAD
jgi:hypothetical protein